MENPEPPEPRTRRAWKVRKEAQKLEEQRIQDECPFVMMVGPTEKVRQRTSDKENDEGRRQLDAIERGDAIVKEEVVEDNEEEPDERQEQDAQKTDEVGEGHVTVKEEATEGGEEGVLEEEPVDNNVLPGGANVAIDIDLLRVLELKEENTLEVGGGLGEGGLAEQELILLDEEEQRRGIVDDSDEGSISHQALEEDADASISEKSVEKSVAIVDQQRGKIIQGNLGSSSKGLDKCTMYVYSLDDNNIIIHTDI